MADSGAVRISYSWWAGIACFLFVGIIIGNDNPVKHIITSPDEIRICYLLGSQETISYLNIKAIHTRRKTGRQGRDGAQVQEIELFNDGNPFVYNEDKFVNYEQLKMAIWNYRLDAF